MFKCSNKVFNSENDKLNKNMQFSPTQTNKKIRPSHDVKNILITVKKKRNKVRTKRHYKLQDYTQPTVIYHLSNFGSSKSRRFITKHVSLPEINKKNANENITKLRVKSLTAIPRKICKPYSKKYTVKEHSLRFSLNPLCKINQPTFKVYRCQLTSNVAENCNNCCCSCNSDAMFEVMKDLYDCYKKRNCDNCNCILCCRLPTETQLDKPGKPSPEINLETALREVAMRGFALPEGKTPSEKVIINNIRKRLGLPPEPTSQRMRDKYTSAANVGVMVPLEGKTIKQKEKILQDFHRLGIPPPVGRTLSEQALIDKIGGKAQAHSVVCECQSKTSESSRKTKRSDLFTTWQGKSNDEIEKILREQAMKGIPLPHGDTESKAKLISKVRADLGLPPSPRTSDLRNKYAKAAEDGILFPLEGKSDKEKERILRGLHERGLPLPEGRTSSEKALVSKILQEKRSPSSKISKTKTEQEKKLRELAMNGIPLPEGKTESDKKILKKVRADLGLPPEPKTRDMRNKYDKATNIGLMLPLEGKSLKEKEKILRGLADLGIPLPKGRTPSELAIIAKVKGEPRDSSMLTQLKMKDVDSSKVILSLEGKTPEEIDKILRKLAMRGIPLPEGKTASQKKLINKVRVELGLPPEPKTPAMKKKHQMAAEEGLLLPLAGKPNEEKEIIIQGLLNMGIPLPKGRTPSEDALIARVKERQKIDKNTSSNIKESEGPVDECICSKLAPPLLISLDLKRRAKAAEQLLEGKTSDEKEKILLSLAMEGIPLPKGKTASEKKLILKIRADLGLPPEPKTASIRDKHEKAAEKNLLQPLKGKSPQEKERILRGLLDLGIQLPKPRTASEKSMIVRLQLEHKTPSEKMKRAKAAGLLTPLEGKTPSQQEEILRGLAIVGIPLPKGKTDSQTKLVIKIRHDLGLPPEPKNSSMRNKYAKAADAGLLVPLEGKTPKEKEKILRGLNDLGIPLPKARSPSEEFLIIKIQGKRPTLTPSEKMRGAKAAGLLTPLRGKTPEQRERILRGLAVHGIPLPEGETMSEKNMINKVRFDLGFPPGPKTPSMRKKYDKAADAGILQPLEGKTPKEKEKILRRLVEVGIPLPKARTASEKALIDKIKGEPGALSKLTSSEKMRKAQFAGLLTPLKGKTPAEIQVILKGLADLSIPLPEGKTASEQNIINKVRLDLGLPPEPKTSAMREKHKKAAEVGLLIPLEGKLPKEKKKILQGLADMGIPLPAGRTESEKRLIAKINEKKTVDRKSSQKPGTSITTEKIRQAKAAGLLTPLAKKSPEEKENILRNLVKLGLPLPEGRTRSDRVLINQIKREYNLQEEPSGEKIRKAIANGLLTPLDGKAPELKEKILRERVAAGLPLPIGKTPSEKDLISKVKASTGYVTPSPSKMLQKAEAAGLLPLKGSKTASEREKTLRQLAAAGIPLPEAKTPSEKEIINKIMAFQKTKSDKIKAAKAAGLLTPLRGKTPAQKEKILRGLVKNGLPLPEAKTPSEKSLIDKIRAETGLPPTPKTPSMRDKYRRAQDAGIITPLEGKNMSEKENILRKLHEEGIPLPVGRTPSEKSLIKRIKAGLLEHKTPFEDMESAKKEKILRSLIKSGRSLPDAKTPSTINLIKQIRKDMGLPPEPTTTSMKDKMRKAYSAGLITPLEGKTSAQKEKILRGLAEAGIPLPEGRTSSEKEMKRRIEDESRKKLHRQITKRITKDKGVSQESGEAWPKIQSSKIRKAEELGFTTPLSGKSPKEKERILRGLAKLGLPLPEGATKSDTQLIKHVRKDMGLPPDPETPSMKKRHLKAAKEGVLYPLEGLSQAEKENLLRSQGKIGLTLPEGRTPSEKSLINKIKEELAISKIAPEKLQRAKEAGLLTPLKGKSQAEKQKILRGRAKAGLPLPEGRTISEKSLIKNIKSEFRKPHLSTEALRKAKERGLLTPLDGKKSFEKEKILHGLAEAGLPFPEGKTSKDRALMKKIKEAHKVVKEKGSEAKMFGSTVTKCERACGCDKKKIRFKHSYVKIKVTSPDISSLCPCPDECVPGVKGGVFIDNQGVNVIIESAVGIPHYRVSSNALSENSQHDPKQKYNLKRWPIVYDIEHKNRNLIRSIYDDNTGSYRQIYHHSQDSLLDTQFTHIPLINESYDKTRTTYIQAPKLLQSSCSKICKGHGLKSNPYYAAADFITYVSHHLTVTASSSRDSFDSIKIIQSETSLSFSSTYDEVSSSSVNSFAASVSSSKSNAYQLSLSNVVFNGSVVLEPECLTNGVECCAIDSIRSSEVNIKSQASTSILIKRKQMPDDVFEVFPMSSTNPSSVKETKNNSTYKDNVGEPVIIITNLNSNLDLTSVVDELITKKEFSEASSLFVVVPTSDEEENEIRAIGLGSTQCVQLSENCNNWQNAQDMQPCTVCRRTPSKTQDLRTTEKPKLYLKNLPTTVLSSISNGRTMYHYVENNRNWVPRNQFCQIITPNAIQEYPGVSTDTTQDRPCCCGQPAPCTNVMSEVIPPVCIQRGLESKTFSVHRITKIPQASYASMIRSPANRMAESNGYPGDESREQILQNPFNAPMSLHLKHFKKLLQRTLSPHTMNKILREIDAGQLDHSSLDDSNGSPSELSPEESLLSNSSLTPTNENYLICHQQKFKRGKLPNWAIKSNKTVRIDAACDCQHHLPSFIKTETDLKLKDDCWIKQRDDAIPKRKKCSAVSKLGHKVTESIARSGTLVSIGVQDSLGCILCISGLPCTSKHKISGRMTSLSNIMSHRTPINIYGHSNQQNGLSPLRSYAAIGSGGTYTPSGSKHLPHRINAGVGVDLKNASTDKYRLAHSNKQVQKNKPFSKYMPLDYDRKQNNIILMKPNLTQTTSRVQFDERSFVKPLVKPSWTIEDLIRYYATFKPDVLKTLLSLTSVKTPDTKHITNNKERFGLDSIRGESSGLTYLAESSDVPVKEVREHENRAFTGFKIKKPGLNGGDLSREKNDMTQQVSSLLTSTISRCEIVPCDGRKACHTPDQILEFPFGTPLSEPLEKLKKLVQLNCSPEKVKHFFEQIEAGNLKDIDFEFEEALKTEEVMNTSNSPTTESDFVTKSKSNCRLPPCEGHPGCHSVDELLQYPFGTPLPPNLVKLKELLEQNCSPKKVKFLFEQIEAGNLNNIDWQTNVEIGIDSPVDVSPSINVMPKSISNCRLPPCHGHPGCHPPDVILEYPFGTPLSPELTELKRLIELNDCPEKVKKLYAQITSENIKNVSWKGDAKLTADCAPSETKSKLQPFQERPRRSSSDKTLQSPSGSPLLEELLGLKKIIEQHDKVKYLVGETETGKRINVKAQTFSTPRDLLANDKTLTGSTTTAMTHRIKPDEKYSDSSHSSLQLLIKDELGNLGYSDNNTTKKDLPFESDSVSNNRPTSKSIPRTSTCVLSSYHPPDEVLQCPYGTALPPHLIRLKELLEEHSNPQKVKELFQKIEAGHFKSSFKTPCSDPPCQKDTSYSTGCHLPDEVLQYPYGVPLSHSLENLKKLIELDACPKKVKKLFKQIQDNDNVCNLNWAGALDDPSEFYYDSNCHNPNCEKSRNYRNQGFMSNVPCPEPRCQKNTGCHLPDEVLQYPFGVPLSHSLENLKKLIEKDACPKKVKQLFKQIQDGDDVCNLDWVGALDDTSEFYSDSNCQNPNCENKRHYSNQDLMSKVPCPEPNCQKNIGCHLPDEVLQYPYGFPLSHSLEKLKKVIEQNSCPKKVKKLFQQIQDGENMCNLDWEGALNSSIGVKPCRNPACNKNRRSSNRDLNSKKPCREPTCPKKTCCDLLDEGLQSPSGIPLSQSLENLKKLIHRNRKPKKVKKCCKQLQDSDNVCNFDFEEEKPCRKPSCKKTPPCNNNNFSPKKPCRDPTCPKKICCHLPDEDLQCAPTISLSKSIENLKKFIERNRNSKKKKKCCKQTANSDNMCHNPYCEGALESNTKCHPEKYFSTSEPNSCQNPCCKKKNRYSNHDSKPKLPCPEPTCQKQTSCHLPDELLQYPFGTPLSHSLENLKKIIERDGCPKKVKKLYKQIQNNDSYCNLDWKGAMDSCSLFDPNDFEPPPKVIPCRTPTCQRSPGCHLAGEIIQYPYNTPLPQQLMELKTFLEQNSNPEEVKDLLGQIEAGHLDNLDFSPDINSPNSELTSPTISTSHIPVCEGQSSCHLPDEILQYPFGTPMPEHLIKLKNLLEQNNNPKKVKELFRQLETGNWKDLDWDGAYETSPYQNPQDMHTIDERSSESPLQALPMTDIKNLLEEICSPGIIQQLVKQIEAGNMNNKKNVGCGGSAAIPVVKTPDIGPHIPPGRTPESILLKDDALPPESLLLKQGAFPPGTAPMIFPPGAPTPDVRAPGVSPRLLLPHMIPIVLPPEVYAPAPKDEDCSTCHKPKYRDGVKMKCACKGKKKTVKKKPCPCELHKVPISTEQSGLKLATHTKPAQCCICDDYFAGVKKSGKDVIFKLGRSAPSIIGTPGGPVSTGVQGGTGCIRCPTGLPCSSDHTTCPKLTNITISPIPLGYYGQPDAQAQMGELEIIGPQGGYVMIGPDGIYTQSGIKVIKFSTGTGTDPDSGNVGAESTTKKKKNCLCVNKRGKKKRKITCQCPSESESEAEPLLLYTYEDFEEARKLSKQYKSDLTQTTSGFKFDKKKQPPLEPTPEYTVEDAIRDYAIIRPDFIRSLVPPGVRRKNKADCACEEDVGVGSYEILKKNAQGVFEYENPVPVPPPDVPLKGLKFSIGGKGSGSKGLSGICCFEMYQDS